MLRFMTPDVDTAAMWKRSRCILTAFAVFFQKTTTERLLRLVARMICIRKVPGSSLHQDTNYSEAYLGFSQFLQACDDTGP